MNKSFNSLSATEIIKICQRELNINFKIQGKDYFCLCPFHSEKTPSLAFDSQKKIFKCFGCEFSAKNLLKFWSKVKGINLNEAQEEIKKLGYDFDYESTIEKGEKSKKEQLFLLVKEIYQHNLFSKSGNVALNYLLKERNLDYSTIKKFNLGCSVDYKQLKNLFNFPDSQNGSEWSKELILTGLIRDNNQNQVSDLFGESQLIIPLENEKSKILAFAARKLTNSAWLENKYIFLPNYEGYQKSLFLYNYQRVKQEKTKNYCYLVEGFFDVISLDKKGITNCLALLGTNISQFQIDLLKKLDKKIVLFLDGDQAGKQANIKISLALLSQNVECEIINHPLEEIDPDEICRDKQDDEISQIIQNREDPYLFILNHFKKNWEVRDNPQSISNFIRQISNLFKGFEKKTQIFLIEKISSLIGWDKEEIKEIYYEKKDIKNNIEPLDGEIFPEDAVLKKELTIIAYCYQDRRYWIILRQQEYKFTKEKTRYFYLVLDNFYTNNWTNQFPIEDNKISIMGELKSSITNLNKEFSEENFRQIIDAKAFKLIKWIK